MFKKLLIFVIILFFGLSYQAQLAQWTFTLNSTSSTSVWRPRRSFGRLFQLPNSVGAGFRSISRTRANGETTINGIRSAAFAVNPNSMTNSKAPTASMAYFQKEIDATSGSNSFNYDVAASSNYVAIRFFSLEEVDANNAVVKRMLLRDVTWSVTNTSIPDSTTNTILDLPFVVLTGSTNGTVVELQFIVTSNLGTVEVTGLNGGSLVPPQGMEIIVSVDFTGYTYQNAANYVRMVTYTATGETTRQTNVVSPNPLLRNQTHNFIQSTTGGIQTSVRFALKGTINNRNVTSVPINFSTETNSSIPFGGDDVQVQFNTKFSNTGVITRSDINFPVNANGIVTYDPTVAFGQDPVTSPSTSSSSKLTFCFVLLFLLILILKF